MLGKMDIFHHISLHYIENLFLFKKKRASGPRCMQPQMSLWRSSKRNYINNTYTTTQKQMDQKSCPFQSIYKSFTHTTSTF
jgi:hypothetical protein